MRILGIDCAAKAGGAAVLEEGKLLGCYTINHNLTHSQTLMPMVDHLLSTLAFKVGDMDYIAVTVGPGSFTGVRIGVATVKGLSMGSGIPCIAVSSLAALACNVYPADKTIACCMDARRGQVYSALFKFEDGALVRKTPDRALAVGELYEQLKEYDGVILAGDAAQLCLDAFSGSLNCVAAGAGSDCLSAAGVCLAARAITTKPGFQPVFYNDLTPVYLRAPQAERERMERKMREEEGNA